MGLLFRLSWQTLIARPTLALLAVLLLAISTSLLAGLMISVNTISSLKGSLLNEMSIEIELAEANDSLQTAYAEELRARPDILSVESFSPREVLDEIEQELGESLRDILSENPFPPVLRVKLRAPTRESLDRFVEEISNRPGVVLAVYPRDLWERLDLWIADLRGKTAYMIGALALLGWILVGLSLRAILKNRATAWQLMLRLGIRPRDLEVVQLLIELVLGLFAGLMAVLTLRFGMIFLVWLFQTPIPAPSGWVLLTLGCAIALSILAGLWAPRPAREN
jgi:cell division protein FtsX